MSSNELDHLVSMINHISRNTSIGLSEIDAAEKIANHINMFWAPSMREKLCANAEIVKDKLLPNASNALVKVNQ
jgi:formate dehydrogenase subunit delta